MKAIVLEGVNISVYLCVCECLCVCVWVRVGVWVRGMRCSSVNACIHLGAGVYMCYCVIKRSIPQSRAFLCSTINVCWLVLACSLVSMVVKPGPVESVTICLGLSSVLSSVIVTKHVTRLKRSDLSHIQPKPTYTDSVIQSYTPVPLLGAHTHASTSIHTHTHTSFLLHIY